VNILILGVQGSGKGTQAKRVAAEYGIAHVSTGEILRAAIAEGSELGRRVQPIIESGRLVPDELIVDLIRERIAGEQGFVLDGFPRTMAQAVALDEMLREEGRELDVVLELQVSDEVATARMLARVEAEGRSDDTPETIRTRLELYHRETEPLVEYYRAKGIVVGIHGERPVDAVFAEIQETLERVAA
jgi:adenylate kinase